MPTEMESLAPCSHEEVEPCLIIHAVDASLRGHQRLKISANDTDVVVLAISVVTTLPVDELWITYGLEKHIQCIQLCSAFHGYVARSR